MKSTIHKYTSTEPMLQVNAFIIETPKELVIVDTTLTMSDSKALKKQADAMNKPVAGIILTHVHPDHIAGTTNIVTDENTPIFAIQTVNNLMETTEEAKHRQWSGMFGAEWIPKWTYPNEIVEDGEKVKIGGLTFTVMDIGSGGDCDANSIWLLEDGNKSAFIGDVLYKNNHTYMNDGSILRWIANLEKLSPILKEFENYHIGHGEDCSFSDIQKQKEYFDLYCGNILKTTSGTGIFSDATRKQFEESMIAKFPNYGCQFMVALSADAVGKELISK